jgi:hypothetical protein
VAIDSRSWSSGLRALALDAAAGSNLIANIACHQPASSSEWGIFFMSVRVCADCGRMWEL